MNALNNFILIEGVEKAGEVDGIIISSDDRRAVRYVTGIVKSIGSQSVLAGEVSPGDSVMFDDSAGHTMLLEGVKIRVVRDRDIVLVL